ncbi:S41 family peptidase [Butyrivibrio sp. X503]|nr:S41 family peptidase [Butyrivibrio sp. X503]
MTEETKTEDVSTAAAANEEIIRNKENEKKLRRRFVSGVLIGAMCMAFVCAALGIVLNLGPIGVDTGSEVMSTETAIKIRKLESLIDSCYYKTEVDKEKERDGLYKGLLSSLDDPYSVYYSQEDLKVFENDTEGIYFGIGAYVSMDNTINMPRISKVMPGTPAEEAGIQADDIITEVNKESVQGLTTEEVVSKIKGEEGTTVHLTLERESQKETVEVDVYRKKIEVPTVEAKKLDDGIGYIQITEFDDVTYNQFVERMAELKSDELNGLIIDLRSNPGGNLKIVCDIADQIIAKGNTIVYTVDRDGNRVDYTCENDAKLDIPIVVLTNGYSASASEILAGALKDYGLAKLVGTTTFGKGIVQSVYDLNDGTAVKLTVSSYYTPNGNNIHGIGIEPDVEIEFDAEAYAEDKSDNQLDKAVEVMKDLLDK